MILHFGQQNTLCLRLNWIYLFIIQKQNFNYFAFWPIEHTLPSIKLDLSFYYQKNNFKDFAFWPTEHNLPSIKLDFLFIIKRTILRILNFGQQNTLCLRLNWIYLLIIKRP